MNLLACTLSAVNELRLLSDYLAAIRRLNGVSLSQVPYGLRRISQAWPGGPDPSYILLVGLILLAGAGAFVLSYYRKNRKKTRVKTINDPDKLFCALLARIDLAEADKKLLRRMASGARLRHPVLCLLSPGLLAWTGRVWLNEQGPRTVTAQTTAQLNNIAVRLYDHHWGSTSGPVASGDVPAGTAN